MTNPKSERPSYVKLKGNSIVEYFTKALSYEFSNKRKLTDFLDLRQERITKITKIDTINESLESFDINNLINKANIARLVLVVLITFIAAVVAILSKLDKYIPELLNPRDTVTIIEQQRSIGEEKMKRGVPLSITTGRDNNGEQMMCRIEVDPERFTFSYIHWGSSSTTQDGRPESSPQNVLRKSFIMVTPHVFNAALGNVLTKSDLTQVYIFPSNIRMFLGIPWLLMDFYGQKEVSDNHGAMNSIV